jgi:hypothetical protein
MKKLLGVGLSVGILAGLWAQYSPALGLVTWVGFVAWAAYFASGAGSRGLTSTLITTMLGAGYGWVVVTVGATIPMSGAVGIGVGLIAALMCLQASWSVLSFIPGAFLGASCFFGNPGGIISTLAALVVGAVIGWLSDTIGKLIQRRVITPTPPVSGASVEASSERVL